MKKGRNKTEVAIFKNPLFTIPIEWNETGWQAAVKIIWNSIVNLDENY